MIGKLTGTVDQVFETSLLLDVNGVGYVVACSQQTLRQISECGARVSVFIETLIRPEQITLYGFLTPLEQEVFRQLLTVQGVGGKVCLSLLSALSAEDICEAIGRQDATLLTRADGVGPKVATRIVNELKGKTFGAFAIRSLATRSVVSSSGNGLGYEALSALTNLGYPRGDVQEVVGRILAQDGAPQTLGDLIPLALKQLSRVG